MLSRRSFVFTSGLTLGGLAWPGPLSAAAGMRNLSSAQRDWLLGILPAEDKRYDPFAKLLVNSAANRPHYNTQIRTGDVHAVGPSLHYAAALLDANEKWRSERAKEILRVAISLQDLDSNSETHGLWPWHLEEPLAKTLLPDPDSAALCAVPLLMIWIGHRDQLDKPLESGVRDAIVHAARSIGRRRLNPDETAAGITGIEVMLLAAQEFKLADLRTAGKARLREFHDHVQRQSSFAEYNSPTRTVTALQELTRMQWLVKDARDRSLISAVHDLAWNHAATHFHPPTQQWAGPHSRSAETDLRKQPSTLGFLQTACSGKANFHLPDPLPLSLESYRVPLQCPRQWVKHFTTLTAPRQVIETFVKGEPNKPGSQSPVVGTTWLHPRFALGSVNRGDFWQERRPLVAYWGTPAAPRYLRIRFLKDDRDFASALFFSVQHEGAVLAAVVFAFDHGNAHPSLDPIRDGTIRARDLRLRFEFGGTSDGLTVKTAGKEQKHLLIQDRDVRWIVRPVGDAFGDKQFTWDFPDLKLANHMDAIAYQGDEKSFKLAELGQAFVCFTIEEWPYDEPESRQASVTFSRGSHAAGSTLRSGEKLLYLSVEKRPQTFAAHCDLFTSRVTNFVQNDLRLPN